MMQLLSALPELRGIAHRRLVVVSIRVSLAKPSAGRAAGVIRQPYRNIRRPPRTNSDILGQRGVVTTRCDSISPS